MPHADSTPEAHPATTILRILKAPTPGGLWGF